MRAYGLAFMLAIALTLTGCNREDHHNEPAARDVGRDAYRASQEIKRGAKKAGKELQKAGKEIRQGWNEAKHEDTRPKK